MPDADLSTDMLTGLRGMVELAVQFGPFLFAVLLLLWITRKAHGYYTGAVAAGVGAADLRIHRRIYCAAWAASFALVALSCGYWLWTQDSAKIYRFTIVDVQEHEHLVPWDDHFHTASRLRETPAGGRLFTLSFLAAMPRHGVQADDTVRLIYSGRSSSGGGLLEGEIELKLAELNGQQLRLNRQAESAPELIFARPVPPSGGLVRSAQAADPPTQRFKARSIPTPAAVAPVEEDQRIEQKLAEDRLIREKLWRDQRARQLVTRQATREAACDTTAEACEPR